MQKTIKRGDIHHADLNPTIGSEQGNYRPVLVVQNDTGNENSPAIVIVPITGKQRKNPLPTHVLIPQSCGLDKDSYALTEQIRTIDRSRLTDFIGHIDNELQSAIDKALAICVGLKIERPKKVDMLELSLCPRCVKNFRESGYIVVKKGWQEYKTKCDFCQTGEGWIYGIFNLNS